MVTDADIAKIMDFGLARRHSESRPEGEKHAHGISGTPAYMSPEQARGLTPSPASDVFALGLILYEMITGRQAIAATSLLEALRLIEHLEPAPLARRTPQPFTDLILEALVNDAGLRSITMEQIAQTLA
jgi:serine/threonine-protein kinase